MNRKSDLSMSRENKIEIQVQEFKINRHLTAELKNLNEDLTHCD